MMKREQRFGVVQVQVQVGGRDPRDSVGANCPKRCGRRQRLSGKDPHFAPLKFKPG
jgi:hypothetical protein